MELADTQPAEHAQRMDRMYRYTRHVYDLSRRYYLLGRDRLLRQMSVRPGDAVLEMGCGTGRNLIKLHRICPGARLLGLDASASMLRTAEANLRRAGCTGAVTLRHALAEQLDYRTMFALDRGLDAIFFSYSLSMMPTWPAALGAALANLAPGGCVYIVDFCDQAGLPRAFAAVLRHWLALFQVHYRPELLLHLEALRSRGVSDLALETLWGRYAYIAALSPRDGRPETDAAVA